MSAQLSMLDLPEPRPKKRGRVPRTSVLAYQQTDARGRGREVLTWLSGYLALDQPPTSAELANRAPFLAAEYQTDGPEFNGTLTVLLYVRRGLSDLLAQGLVEHGPKRTCAVSGRTCVTWVISGR